MADKEEALSLEEFVKRYIYIPHVWRSKERVFMLLVWKWAAYLDTPPRKRNSQTIGEIDEEAAKLEFNHQARKLVMVEAHNIYERWSTS